MIRGVIFDLGSTLIRFDGEFAAVRGEAHQALVQALEKEGAALRVESFLARFIRDLDDADRRRNHSRVEITTFDILAEALRAEGIDLTAPERLRRALRAMYAVYEKRWRLYPETLAALRQTRLLRLKQALVSNAADEPNVRRLLARHKLGGFFQPTVISAAIGIRKPDPRAFQPVLDAWKIPAAEIVMVGDQLGMDILGARTLGMRSIWIRTEEHAPANRELLGMVEADAQVTTIGEVAAILRHWRSHS
jgi:HAD superfamily hydrolase (TIGR01549 family)